MIHPQTCAAGCQCGQKSCQVGLVNMRTLPLIMALFWVAFLEEMPSSGVLSGEVWHPEAVPNSAWEKHMDDVHISLHLWNCRTWYLLASTEQWQACQTSRSFFFQVGDPLGQIPAEGKPGSGLALRLNNLPFVWRVAHVCHSNSSAIVLSELLPESTGFLYFCHNIFPFSICWQKLYSTVLLELFGRPLVYSLGIHSIKIKVSNHRTFLISSLILASADVVEWMCESSPSYIIF